MGNARYPQAFLGIPVSPRYFPPSPYSVDVSVVEKLVDGTTHKKKKKYKKTALIFACNDLASIEIPVTVSQVLFMLFCVLRKWNAGMHEEEVECWNFECLPLAVFMFLYNAFF